jgi:hypothetical protein
MERSITVVETSSIENEPKKGQVKNNVANLKIVHPALTCELSQVFYFDQLQNF